MIRFQVLRRPLIRPRDLALAYPVVILLPNHFAKESHAFELRMVVREFSDCQHDAACVHITDGNAGPVEQVRLGDDVRNVCVLADRLAVCDGAFWVRMRLLDLQEYVKFLAVHACGKVITACVGVTLKRLWLSDCLDRSSFRGAQVSVHRSEFSRTSLLILWKFSTGFSGLCSDTDVSTCRFSDCVSECVKSRICTSFRGLSSTIQMGRIGHERTSINQDLAVHQNSILDPLHRQNGLYFQYSLRAKKLNASCHFFLLGITSLEKPCLPPSDDRKLTNYSMQDMPSHPWRWWPSLWFQLALLGQEALKSLSYFPKAAIFCSICLTGPDVFYLQPKQALQTCVTQDLDRLGRFPSYGSRWESTFGGFDHHQQKVSFVSVSRFLKT
jgi:hypothetical protein